MRNEKTGRPAEYTPSEWANINFYGNYCNFADHLEEISNYLNEFQNYIQVTNHHLQNGRISGHDAEHLDSMRYNFQHTHGNILRQSTIISLYILLENAVDEYCETFKKHSGGTIKLSDFKGDILERLKTYLKKVASIPFDFSSGLWQYIIGLHEVRNCLVHNNGVVEGFGKRKVIEQFARQQNLITIRDEYFIEITFNGCKESIEQVDRLLVTLTELAFDKYPGSYRLKKASEFVLPIDKS